MQNPTWIDGTIVDISEAKVSLEDRGYLFGDGVYEVTRIYNSKPFYLGAHLTRLRRSAAAIRITVPYTNAEIENAVTELIEKSGCTDGYIYMQLTRGSAKRDHLFPADTKPGMTMYVSALPALPALEEIKPVKCITLPDERWLNCHIKTVNLLPNLLARQKAADAGAQEAILYRPGDLVTEGTRSNVFAVIEGKVRTHPESNLILSGITRGIVIDIITEQAIDFIEEPFTLTEMKTASEIWITSTTMEVNPVAAIDERAVNGPAPGQISRRLMKEFRKKIAADCY